MWKPRPFTTFFLIASSLAALLTSPTAHAQDTKNEELTTPPSESLPSIGSTTASNTTWKGAYIEIFDNKVYLYPSGKSGDGVVLIDESHGLRFNTYIDGENDCLCAGVDASPGAFQLITEPGSHTTYWASYQLSEDTEEVTIEIPGFLPIKDVPVS